VFSVGGGTSDKLNHHGEVRSVNLAESYTHTSSTLQQVAIILHISVCLNTQCSKRARYNSTAAESPP